jgi:hypothetical protein
LNVAEFKGEFSVGGAVFPLGWAIIAAQTKTESKVVKNSVFFMRSGLEASKIAEIKREGIISDERSIFALNASWNV